MCLGESHILKTRVPKDWIPQIQALMDRYGFSTYDEFLRAIIRETLRREGLLKVVV